MKSRQVCMCMFGIVALIIGCDAEEVPPGPPNLGSYSSPTAPENLINNLQVSYRRREIKEYAKILAPEFLFKFQPVDQSTIGKESWTRDEDSVGTRALFTTLEVAEIRITLLYAGRDSSTDKAPPADSVNIRIQTTELQIDQTNDITWVVNDQQDLFFRKGIATNGENASHWFMYEWHDLPTQGSPKFAAGGEMTWGNLKNLYPTGDN